MALIIQLVFLSSLAALSYADVAASLASYQNSAEGVFNALQNDLNENRQAYNQAFAKLSADINHTVDIKVRQAQDQVQNECNGQLYELNRRLQELTNRTSSEKARLQAELQTQTLNSEQRMNELIKIQKKELNRVRSEMSAANAQTLNNLRMELEGQVGVAHNEVARILLEYETALRNVQKGLDLTSKEGETQF